jgi:hypothetical protein
MDKIFKLSFGHWKLTSTNNWFKASYTTDIDPAFIFLILTGPDFDLRPGSVLRDTAAAIGPISLFFRGKAEFLTKYHREIYGGYMPCPDAESCKKHVDQFLIRMNNLKLFI